MIRCTGVTFLDNLDKVMFETVKNNKKNGEKKLRTKDFFSIYDKMSTVSKTQHSDACCCPLLKILPSHI